MRILWYNNVIVRRLSCILIVLIFLAACGRKVETTPVPGDKEQTAKAKQLLKPMKDALEQCNWDAIKELLDKGADINTANRQGLSALHLAARHGQNQLAQLLIERHTNLNARDNEGQTPLHHAVVCRIISETVIASKKEIVKSLLESGADVNAKDNRGYTSLDVVLMTGVSRLLKEHGAKSGQPLSVELFKAIQSEDVNKVREVLDKGADPNAVNPEGWSALSLVSHHFEQIWAGAGFSKESGEHRREIARILVEHGADINGSGKDDIPLLSAASNGNRAVAEFLVEAGADINARGKYGDTVLHEAADHGNRETVEYILSLGIDVMTRNDFGYTPLHSAFSFTSCKEVVELLVSHGADVNAVSKQGETPLHRATFSCLGTEAIAFLISKGANINAKDKNGETPLHDAARNNRDYAIKFLLSKGADATIANKDGKLPRDLAKEDRIKKLIEQHAEKNDE